MEFTLPEHGIVLFRYRDIKENEGILPVICNGKEIDDNTTIVFEKYNFHDSIDVENPFGHLERETLWLCTGFAYCNCKQMIHYIKSSIPVKEQLEKVYYLANYHGELFEMEKIYPTEGSYIYGFVHLEDLVDEDEGDEEQTS